MVEKIKREMQKRKIFMYIGIGVFCFRYIVYRILYFIFHLLPVKKGKIVCCSTKGKRYGDNPKAISDVLIKYPHLEIYWLLRENVDDNIPDRIRMVKYNFLSEIYHLSTAQVWIDSNMKAFGTTKKKSQLFVQTWHGSYGIKKMCKDLGDNLPFFDKVDCLSNSKMYDVMLSNSRRTTEIYRSAFDYSGKIIEVGSPRNDIFLEKDTSKYIAKVSNYFHIKEKRIALYAPTFRDDYSVNSFKLDYERLIEILEKKFGGEWVVFIRLHPNNLAAASEFITYDTRKINASEYNNMQELLVASDILITDYSSCMFDFATTKKPCFIYATDLKAYNDARGCYFSMEELPFPLAESNNQLEELITAFDYEKYENDVNGLFNLVGLNETGSASETIAEYIVNWMENN